MLSKSLSFYLSPNTGQGSSPYYFHDTKGLTWQTQKKIGKRLRLFWGVSYGSIYPTLSALLEDGMISANDVSTNKQAKIAYTTTDKGRPHLWEWLEVSVGKNEMRYETLLKLFWRRD